MENNNAHKLLTDLENVFTQHSKQVSEDAAELKKLEARLTVAKKDRDEELLKDEPNFKEVKFHEDEIKKIKEEIAGINKLAEEQVSNNSNSSEQIEE